MFRFENTSFLGNLERRFCGEEEFCSGVGTFTAFFASHIFDRDRDVNWYAVDVNPSLNVIGGTGLIGKSPLGVSCKYSNYINA